MERFVPNNPRKSRPNASPSGNGKKRATNGAFGSVLHTDDWDERSCESDRESPDMRVARTIAFEIANCVEDTINELISEGRMDKEESAVVIAHALAIAVSSFLAIFCENRADAEEGADLLANHIRALLEEI